jgi:hypothetical protein
VLVAHQASGEAQGRGLPATNREVAMPQPKRSRQRQLDDCLAGRGRLDADLREELQGTLVGAHRDPADAVRALHALLYVLKSDRRLVEAYSLYLRTQTRSEAPF